MFNLVLSLWPFKILELPLSQKKKKNPYNKPWQTSKSSLAITFPKEKPKLAVFVPSLLKTLKSI